MLIDIKTFLKKHDIKSLIFFNGHSHLFESYLCEVKQEHKASKPDSSFMSHSSISSRSEIDNHRLILQALKVKKAERKKVQDKISQLYSLDPNLVELCSGFY